MMDELELLKRDWKKNETNFKQVSESEIYKMQFKSSSSIVKWIFIVSVLELLLAPIIGILFNNNNNIATLKKYHLQTVMDVFTVLNYIVIIYFIYKFYKNYQTISANDSVKALLKNIINTRKTVKHYITYNLIMSGIIFTLIISSLVMYEPALTKTIEKIGGVKGYVIVFGVCLVIISLLLFVIWLIYKLLYGFLIKRLNQNYKELQRINI